jgi:predicted phosphodiesterase
MSRTLILSDIHFCRKPSKVTSGKQIRALWEGCDTLVLNGDTTETHSIRYSDESKKLTRELVDLAKKDGVTTRLICGNHDPLVSETDYLWFCNNQVLVFHGHVAFPNVAPWSWRAPFVLKARQAYLEESGDGFLEQLIALRKASHDSASGKFSTDRPSTVKMLLLGLPATFRIFQGWWKFPSLISNWVEQYAPSANYIITGHTHHAGIWKRNGRVIVNTGCFGFPTHPRAVIIEDSNIAVYRLRISNGVYSLGRVCDSWNAR